ncbi:MAG: hypothetical protein EOP43_07180, partial [Sphingobacteriaceae bacterium]
MVIQKHRYFSHINWMFLCFIGLIITYFQWRKDQKYKQKELLLKRIIAFSETPGALNAELMLASADRDVPLWAKEKIEERYIRIKRQEVAVALIPETYLPFQYSSKESAIKDSFDDFLIKLSHIEMYMSASLLSSKDVKVIMNNVITTLNNLKNGSEVDQSLLKHLYLYIIWKKHAGVIKLFKRFNIKIDEEIKEYEEVLIE